MLVTICMATQWPAFSVEDDDCQRPSSSGPELSRELQARHKKSLYSTGPAGPDTHREDHNKERRGQWEPCQPHSHLLTSLPQTMTTQWVNREGPLLAPPSPPRTTEWPWLSHPTSRRSWTKRSSYLRRRRSPATRSPTPDITPGGSVQQSKFLRGQLKSPTKAFTQARRLGGIWHGPRTSRDGPLILHVSRSKLIRIATGVNWQRGFISTHLVLEPSPKCP